MRGSSPEVARDKVKEDLESYARDACQGNNTITVDDKAAEMRLYVPKIQAEIRVAAKNEDEARKLLKEKLGEDVFVDEVFKESVRPYGRGH